MPTPQHESRPWQWTPARFKAAAEIAEDARSDEDIAAAAGVHRATLFRWKQHPEFAARVHDIRDEYFRSLTAAVAREWDRKWEESMARSRERRRRRGR